MPPSCLTDPNRSQYLRRDQQGGAEADPPAPDTREHAQLPHIGESCRPRFGDTRVILSFMDVSRQGFATINKPVGSVGGLAYFSR